MTDIRDCEILYHVDMPIEKHTSATDLANTARLAGHDAWMEYCETFKDHKDLTLLVCLVRLPKPVTQ